MIIIIALVLSQIWRFHPFLPHVLQLLRCLSDSSLCMVVAKTSTCKMFIVELIKWLATIGKNEATFSRASRCNMLLNRLCCIRGCWAILLATQQFHVQCAVTYATVSDIMVTSDTQIPPPPLVLHFYGCSAITSEGLNLLKAGSMWKFVLQPDLFGISVFWSVSMQLGQNHLLTGTPLLIAF